MIESAALFGRSHSLVGIVTAPPPDLHDSSKPAVIFLNAGLVHRVGPNRLYVRLARRLAAKGYWTVRFDHSGIGDSLPAGDNQSYAERYTMEVREVMEDVFRRCAIDRFCLVGLCSGAMTSINTAGQDDRVVGAALLNARGFTENLEWAGYVERRWEMKEFIRKLFTLKGIRKTLTGKAPYAKAVKVVRDLGRRLLNKRQEMAGVAPEITDNLRSLVGRDVRLLWLSSEEDSSREYLGLVIDIELGRMQSAGLMRQIVVARSNHTFDTLAVQDQVMAAVEAWLLDNWQ